MGGGPPLFRQGSTCLVLLWILLAELSFHVRGFHSLWQAFPKPFHYNRSIPFAVRTPECTHSGLGSFPFARRYSGNRCFFLFLRVLRCFSSPGSLPCVMDWRMDDWCCPAGFPHSEICGSSDICSFPQLIAAYHVFLRLLVPRHPPCALIRLTSCYAYL